MICCTDQRAITKLEGTGNLASVVQIAQNVSINASINEIYLSEITSSSVFSQRAGKFRFF